MKYYAFDWDDNIVYMPTEIILKDSNNFEVGMSTHDFAKYRCDIGKNQFIHRGRVIVDFAEKPFRQFKVEGDNQFLEDILLAKIGPSFNDFRESINNGSIFSIITARGHNPETLKKAVRRYIDINFNGINKEKVICNLTKFRDLIPVESDNDIIDEYLDLCKFYPVSFGSGSAANPEDEKVKALNEFYDYCKSMARKVKKAFAFKNDIKGDELSKLKFSIGFSDDDIKNIETIKNKINKLELIIYSTNTGSKEKV